MYPVSKAFLNAVKAPFLARVKISDLNIRKGHVLVMCWVYLLCVEFILYELSERMVDV